MSDFFDGFSKDVLSYADGGIPYDVTKSRMTLRYDRQTDADRAADWFKAPGRGLHPIVTDLADKGLGFGFEVDVNIEHRMVEACSRFESVERVALISKLRDVQDKMVAKDGAIEIPFGSPNEASALIVRLNAAMKRGIVPHVTGEQAEHKSKNEWGTVLLRGTTVGRDGFFSTLHNWGFQDVADEALKQLRHGKLAISSTQIALGGTGQVAHAGDPSKARN